MCKCLLLHLIMFNGKNTHSVRFLWTRDLTVAEIFIWQHKHSQETDIYAPGEIRTCNPRKRAATNLRLRPHCHWDRRRDSKKKSYFHASVNTLHASWKEGWDFKGKLIIMVVMIKPLKKVLDIRPNTTIQIYYVSLTACFGYPDQPSSGRCRIK
jgi:hypothetical protein